MSATQSWLMPVTVMRAAKFTYTWQSWWESVVRTNLRNRTASRLSVRIVRSTRLWLTTMPRRCSSAVTRR